MRQFLGSGRSNWLIATFLVVASCGSSSDDNGNDDAGNGGKGGSDTPKGGTGGSTDDVIKGSDELLGTADSASCTSYTPAKDDMCAGWFCGVSEERLMEVVNPEAKCGSNVPLLCKGSVPVKVAICARRLKSENFNATNDELRPKVRDCVYEDETIKEAVPENCLNCSIDAAACAGDNCLIQCAGGDNEPCDTCRRTNGCDQQVFRCGGLPPTFE